MQLKASVNHSFRLTPDFNEDVLNYCRTRSITISELVRQLLRAKVYEEVNRVKITDKILDKDNV